MDNDLPETEEASEIEEGYLSIADAAQLLGVSTRSVYGYVGEGKLDGKRIKNRLMLKAEAVRAFKPRGPGRIRTKVPVWHQPPGENLSYMTTITALVRPGQGERLEEKVIAWRHEKKHMVIGTAARYVVRDQRRPEEVTILLVWRAMVMPERECRDAVLAALGMDLGEVVEWEMAEVKEGKVLLHA